MKKSFKCATFLIMSGLGGCVLPTLFAQDSLPKGGSNPADAEKIVPEEIDLESLIEPWSVEDYGKLIRGELVAGEDFFGPEAFSSPDEGFVMPEVDEEPFHAEAPKIRNGAEVLTPAQVNVYFGGRPARYLSDPQGLLSEQVYGDRAGFLDYHAGDSKIDFYIYLFDASQSPPPEYSVQAVFDKHFRRSGDTVVVFYELGQPQHARWALSDSIKRLISPSELSGALSEAVDAAFRKSDPADQLDNFSIQLSNRIHWIENTLESSAQAVAQNRGQPLADREGEGGFGSAENLSLEEGAGIEVELEDAEPQWWENPFWQMVAGGTALGLLLLVSFIRMVRRARARRQYKFASFEVPVSLGATQGTGVGAVISFSSSRLPPSLQREQVPDHLESR